MGFTTLKGERIFPTTEEYFQQLLTRLAIKVALASFHSHSHATKKDLVKIFEINYTPGFLGMAW